ncbi:DUF86 domain-containing protein [Geomicrobium sp. JCM 19039]|uniref:DUF86 domain-containing protein n=1 Tax=Geomicrobium sp. JCM 19039 TaxID=1460636 RepID=UPI00045F4BD9|nr:DUF86 domain-containing protein [Geomicrobium sp. JCM 19039]GAK14037.1 hypothetical protein JCM19039_3930 [Geomicrobium sp. JCM 19039]
MYFVDRKLIYRRLRYMDRLMETFRSQPSWEGAVDELALERITQGYIEAMLDVGNQMIDGFIMRDPGSYSDILDILEDERVISSEEAASLQKVLAFRKVLVEDYLDIDHIKLHAVIQGEQQALKEYSSRVTEYLDRELGPVSAFLPDNEGSE